MTVSVNWIRFLKLDLDEVTKNGPLDGCLIYKETEEKAEYEITVFGRSAITRIISKRVWSEVITKSAARRASSGEGIAPDNVDCVK